MFDIACTSRGRFGRVETEDRHVVHHEDDSSVFLAVYDGHGGPEVSQYASQHLHTRFFHFLESVGVEESFKRAYVITDKDLSLEDQVSHCHAGSTATTIFMRGSDLYVAWVGDSRAVCLSSDAVTALTVDDNARTNVEEVNRIRAEGGYIANGRVNNYLAVTRAIGDAVMRDVGVTPQPHVCHYSLNPNKAYVIVIASDGLWDVMSNDQVHQLYLQEPQASAEELATCLLRKTIAKRSADDVTIVCCKIKK